MRKEFMVERQGKAFCLYAGLLDLAHQQGLKSISTQIVQAPTEANNRIAICSATVVLASHGPDGQSVERLFTGIGDAAPNNVAPAMQSCLLRMAETRAKARALRDAVNIGVAAFEELDEDDANIVAEERGYAGVMRGGRPNGAAVERSTTGNGAAARPAAAPRAARPELNEAVPAEPSAGATNGMRANREGTRPQSRAGAAEPSAASTVSERRGDSADTHGDHASEAQIEAIRNLSRRKSVDPEAEAKERFSAESLASLTQSQAVEMIRELNGRPAARAAATA